MTPPPTFLAASIQVALGGGLGAWLRYLTGLGWSRAIGPTAAGAFPWATLSVNVAGSLAMGLLAGWLARQGSHGEGWRLLLGVGVLGGYTTFSAFSLELAQLVERGSLGTAFAYAAVSLTAGLGGLFAGLALMRTAT
ncbi:MAG: fluoride efflux transporter CrcB [Sphingomonadaceae bacterium]